MTKEEFEKKLNEHAKEIIFKGVTLSHLNASKTIEQLSTWVTVASTALLGTIWTSLKVRNISSGIDLTVKYSMIFIMISIVIGIIAKWVFVKISVFEAFNEDTLDRVKDSTFKLFDKIGNELPHDVMELSEYFNERCQFEELQYYPFYRAWWKKIKKTEYKEAVDVSKPHSKDLFIAYDLSIMQMILFIISFALIFLDVINLK